MANIISVYTGCTLPIWDYYFNLNNHKYVPAIWIGDSHQRQLAEKINIIFFDRLALNNLELKFEYSFSFSDNIIVSKIQNNSILYKMYFRNSHDYPPDKILCDDLTIQHETFWFSIINTHKVQANIFLEMPHLPFAYIGYLIFRELNLVTLFSSTLPFKDKSFWLSKIENYGIFGQIPKKDYQLHKPENKSASFYLEKLKLEYGLPQKTNSNKNLHLLIALAIFIRNYVFPFKTNRFKFNVIRNKKFIPLSERLYHLHIIKTTLLRAWNKHRYQKLTIPNISKTSGLNIFFGLHFEPELAVYPMAGENNDQYQIIKTLSDKIGSDGVIYIKEHPWIFDYSKTQGINRGKNFYINLSKMKNVKLLDYRLPTSEIFPKIDLVVTLTGTIGWEAFLQNIPVLYFGIPWYGGMPCSQNYHPNIDINRFVNDCAQMKDKIDYKGIFEFLNTNIYDVSVKMKVNSETEYHNKSVLLKDIIENFEHIFPNVKR
jgi:hypothetical protein